MDAENAVDNRIVAQTRTFSILSVFRRSWRVFWANPLVYIGLASIMSLFFIALFSQISVGRFMAVVRASGGLVYPSILGGLLFLPIEGAVACVVYRNVTGQNMSFGLSALRVLRSFPSIIAVQLFELGLAALSVMIFLIALAAAFSLLLRLIAFLCVLLIIMTKWAVAVPVCVIEGCGPVRGVNRSSELTNGCFFKVFFVIFLSYVADKVNTHGVTRLITLFAFGDPISPALPGFIIATLLYAFQLVVGVVLYFELCAAKSTTLKS